MNELTKLLITFHESMNKLDADRKAVQLAMTENDIEKLVWNAAIDAPKFDELWDEHSEHIGDNRFTALRWWGFKAQMFNPQLMFNRITNDEFTTSAPLLQNRCYA